MIATDIDIMRLWAHTLERMPFIGDYVKWLSLRDSVEAMWGGVKVRVRLGLGERFGQKLCQLAQPPDVLSYS